MCVCVCVLCCVSRYVSAGVSACVNSLFRFPVHLHKHAHHHKTRARGSGRADTDRPTQLAGYWILNAKSTAKVISGGNTQSDHKYTESVSNSRVLKISRFFLKNG